MTDKAFQRKLEKMKKQGERYKQMNEEMAPYLEYLPAVKAKKKKSVSNVVLTIVIIAVVSYTIANFWLAKTTGMYMDSTLTTCVYSFFGSELLCITGIK